MENLELIKFKEQEGVGIITLNNPKVNGLTPQLVSELKVSVQYCKAEASIRCVLITGEGRFFSAGADVPSMLKAGDQIGELSRKVADELHESLNMLLQMDKPVITAINGFVAGGGFGLAVVGDIVIASEKAQFSLAYTNSGLTPDGGSTYLLPRLIGIRRTVELALTNKTLSAQDALEWNLINEVVTDEQLAETALALAKKLAKGPTDAFGQIKKLMLSTYANSFEEQTELEKEGIASQLTSFNGQEGIKAFVEKRKPNFK